jgi:DNA-binding NtrC family response regulator
MSLAATAEYECLTATEFSAARRFVIHRKPDALISSLRLAAFNGIHLAFLAKADRPATRVMIYAQEYDRFLAVEAQAVGAFYEHQAFVPLALPSFLQAALPDRDRRRTDTHDRRAPYRGGRRAIDIRAVESSASR